MTYKELYNNAWESEYPKVYDSKEQELLAAGMDASFASDEAASHARLEAESYAKMIARNYC